MPDLLLDPDMREGDEYWSYAEFLDAVDGQGPMALRAFATLRIADHLATGACTASTLAERTGADPDALRRLLGYLGSRGVVSSTGPGCFGLTEFSVLLLEGHPGRLRQWLDEGGIGARLDAATASLMTTVLTGEPAYPRVHGRDFYPDLAEVARADVSSGFDSMRSAYAEQVAGWVAGRAMWAAHNHVVDVGGGAGTVLLRILERHELLRGTLVDLPDAVGLAEQAKVASEAGDRLTTQAGSFFDELPPGDAFLLVNVVHNWDDSAAVTILRRCAEALAPGGAVYVVEETTDTTPARTMSAMDLRMLLLCGGAERSIDQFRSLGAHAGLRLDHVEGEVSDHQLLRYVGRAT